MSAYNISSYYGYRRTSDDWSTTGGQRERDMVRRMVEQAAQSVTTSMMDAGEQRLAELTQPTIPVALRERAKTDPVIALLVNWMADETNDDVETWPRLKQAIEENRLSDRSRFSD